MLSVLLLAVSIGLISYAYRKWSTLNSDYFAKRNLTFQKQKSLPISFYKTFLGTETGYEFIQKVYYLFPNEKLFGSFFLREPLVIVRDPELIKQLAVKEFDCFEERRPFVNPTCDELFGNSLFLMTGQRWRDMRATLSPAFTGSKMRQMCDLISECADRMVQHFVKQSAAGKKIDYEVKELFSRYTNDVIASCAFGIQINSFEDPENEFFVAGKKLMNFGGGGLIRFIFVLLIPSLAKKLKVQITTASMRNFLSSMVIDTMEMRKERGIFRPDMINILMQVRQGKTTQEAAAEQLENSLRDSAGFATVEESSIGQKESRRHWTDKELISQCFLFFLAGYETTSTTLTFLTYELCVNQDVQQKLYEEIAEMDAILDGKRIDYETLQKMKYLDQVISETLRKWPSLASIDRRCGKTHSCEYDVGKRFQFEKGIAILVPVYGLHHDPKYFPEPDRFNPERFSNENRGNIVPGSYMPFGVGPRNCIGEWFHFIYSQYRNYRYH